MARWFSGIPFPQVGKSSANRASKAANKKAATAAAEEGSAALSAVFAKGSKALEDLRKVAFDCWEPAHNLAMTQPDNDTGTLRGFCIVSCAALSAWG